MHPKYVCVGADSLPQLLFSSATILGLFCSHLHWQSTALTLVKTLVCPVPNFSTVKLKRGGDLDVSGEHPDKV